MLSGSSSGTGSVLSGFPSCVPGVSYKSSFVILYLRRPVRGSTFHLSPSRLLFSLASALGILVLPFSGGVSGSSGMGASIASVGALFGVSNCSGDCFC